MITQLTSSTSTCEVGIQENIQGVRVLSITHYICFDRDIIKKIMQNYVISAVAMGTYINHNVVSENSTVLFVKAQKLFLDIITA